MFKFAAAGQCGGVGWTGRTTCVSGSVCSKQNDYYSQCISGAGAPGTTVAPTTAPTAPATSAPGGSPTTVSAPSTPSSTPAAGNPFTGFQVYLSPYYSAEIASAAAAVTDSSLKAKAASVANIPTFTWLDSVAKVPDLGTYLADASSIQTKTGQKQLVPIVVYELPDRDCAAKASNGEFSIADAGAENYKDYIDQIVPQIKQFPDVRVVAVIEPDSLANLVTNLNVQKCANGGTYKASVTYALQQLSSVGVTMYMDAGHAGWLGWPANIQPGSEVFAEMFKSADFVAFVRAFATNVREYNALTAAFPRPITQGNPNYDEFPYIQRVRPMLKSPGFPAQFVVDQGRAGQQNFRQQWGDWCNIKGAGFGTRPTTSTGNPLIDAIIWVKPGGESDGTSNSSSPRYDSTLLSVRRDDPAPEAGTWFQAYFETLVSKPTRPL
uniref:Glucanase n=1 Tax=Trametes versicolor TaxID=5325 RepID=Q9P8N1_TRAVE|nr:cellobiohydrolase [Trametes versicolor]